ncbi:hypothetical protein Pelo_18099 [Pelomyxa schiedti]|nr:hypothetical protein Pelo_18099 [Pelomyxa schiedti]
MLKVFGIGDTAIERAARVQRSYGPFFETTLPFQQQTQPQLPRQAFPILPTPNVSCPTQHSSCTVKSHSDIIHCPSKRQPFDEFNNHTPYSPSAKRSRAGTVTTPAQQYSTPVVEQSPSFFGKRAWTDPILAMSPSKCPCISSYSSAQSHDVHRNMTPAMLVAQSNHPVASFQLQEGFEMRPLDSAEHRLPPVVMSAAAPTTTPTRTTSPDSLFYSQEQYRYL